METITLTGCGTVRAVRYGDVKVGDVLVYNYGERYEVTAVEEAGPFSVWVTTVAIKSGNTYRNRRTRKTLIGLEG